jgi:hypothetical protein
MNNHVLEGKIMDWGIQAKIIKWIFRKKLKLSLETTPVIFAEENLATDEEHKILLQNAVCDREGKEDRRETTPSFGEENWPQLA